RALVGQRARCVQRWRVLRPLLTVVRADGRPTTGVRGADEPCSTVLLAEARVQLVAVRALHAGADGRPLRMKLAVVDGCAEAVADLVEPAGLGLVAPDALEARALAGSVRSLPADRSPSSTRHERRQGACQAQTANLERGPAGDTT